MQKTKSRIRIQVISLILLSCFNLGCAIHYYDEDTGVEHIWGFGHLKMKSAKPNEGLQAVVHGTDVVGVSVGKADKQGYFTVGWHRLEYIEVLQESISVRLEWPKGTFANIRVGSQFPLYLEDQAINQKEKTP